MYLRIQPIPTQNPNRLKARPFSMPVAAASSPTIVRAMARLPLSKPHTARVVMAHGSDSERPNRVMETAVPKSPKIRQGFRPRRSEMKHHIGVENICTTKKAEAGRGEGGGGELWSA